MTELRKAAEMALSTLIKSQPLTHTSDSIQELMETIRMLRQALAQPEQEPVDIHCPSCLHSFSIVPVAKRQWVSLTDEEIHKIIDDYTPDEAELEEINDFAKAIFAVEAALRSKNNG